MEKDDRGKGSPCSSAAEKGIYARGGKREGKCILRKKKTTWRQKEPIGLKSKMTERRHGSSGQSRKKGDQKKRNKH